MNRVRVRRAAPEDVDALVDLFVAVVEEGRWLGAEPPVDREIQRERFLLQIEPSTETASLVAVTVDGEVIGHARVDVTPYNVAGLGMMVDVRWRGQGVGSLILEAAIDAAREIGAHKLALQLWTHNEPARRLYERHGFTEEGVLRRHYPRRNGELWDAMIMGLVLDETSPGSPYGP